MIIKIAVTGGHSPTGKIAQLNIFGRTAAAAAGGNIGQEKLAVVTGVQANISRTHIAGRRGMNGAGLGADIQRVISSLGAGFTSLGQL